MKRMGLCAMLLGCALLCACGAAPSAGQNLQEQYAAVKTAQLEAEVVCHLEGESRSYTVQYLGNVKEGSAVRYLNLPIEELKKAAIAQMKGGDAVTTITTPEELAGISATVSGSDLTLTYDGTGLAAGPLRDVCAANCLPLLLRAVSDGYILEQGKETIEGQPCLRLALDATLPSGEKVLCTGWFYGADLTPCYAEFSQDGKLLVSARITYFTFEVAPDGA